MQIHRIIIYISLLSDDTEICFSHKCHRATLQIWKLNSPTHTGHRTDILSCFFSGVFFHWILWLPSMLPASQLPFNTELAIASFRKHLWQTYGKAYWAYSAMNISHKLEGFSCSHNRKKRNL